MKVFSSKSAMIKKMWLNQFAFSLFGLFVASPFTGNLCIIAGIFSYLFYLFVVGYSVIDDAQKDKIKLDAGRGEGLCALTGLKYSLIAFIPSFLVTFGYMISTLFVKVSGVVSTIVFVIVKYAFCGEILGIDIGLTKYRYAEDTLTRVSDAPESILFMSEHAIFQLIFIVLSVILLSVVYYLAFSGIIRLKTSEEKK